MANATPLHYGRHKNIQKEPLPVLANAMQTGVASGSAATVVFTCPAGSNVCIDYIDYAYRTTPTAGSIQISDGTLTWGPFTIAAAGKNRDNFDPPLLFTKGANVTVTLADGSVTKDLFAQGHVDGTEVY
jgi:hypothetical protein